MTEQKHTRYQVLGLGECLRSAVGNLSGRSRTELVPVQEKHTEIIKIFNQETTLSDFLVLRGSKTTRMKNLGYYKFFKERR